MFKSLEDYYKVLQKKIVAHAPELSPNVFQFAYKREQAQSYLNTNPDLPFVIYTPPRNEMRCIITYRTKEGALESNFLYMKPGVGSGSVHTRDAAGKSQSTPVNDFIDQLLKSHQSQKKPAQEETTSSSSKEATVHAKAAIQQVRDEHKGDESGVDSAPTSGMS